MKVPYQMAKSKAKTYQTNDKNCHIPDLVRAFFLCRNFTAMQFPRMKCFKVSIRADYNINCEKTCL